ncbi:pirin family protein [Pelobacter seleniigenes]|uniref:pirin family protein n=1 Tax=Pelobacter seleniigenes TaxID=407188 RepID=UPI0004A70BF1|nr:pirin family protein [Pelobacter seleniigenes]
MIRRRIKRISTSVPTMDGAGVHLRRAFANNETELFDPFLLLDDFRSDNPAHYQKGFPWHPHRGIETITYVLKGDVEHGDSLGNKGDISDGDVQWMTAGSGIIHQEMPKGDQQGRMDGFQLWANLPAAHKMMPPRYRDITAAQIPTVKLDGGVEIKVVCGRVGEIAGPVTDVMIEPEYLDVRVPAHGTFHHPTPSGHTVFAYIFAGEGRFEEDDSVPIGDHTLVLFEDGEQIQVVAAEQELRFLLISGKPLGEPIAWGGPIVMNTQEELQLAFDELRDGNFIKHS